MWCDSLKKTHSFWNWSKFFLIKLFRKIRSSLYNKQRLNIMYKANLITFNDYKHGKFDLMFNLWWWILILIYKYWLKFRLKLWSLNTNTGSLKRLIMDNNVLFKWLLFLLNIFNWLNRLAQISLVKDTFLDKLWLINKFMISKNIKWFKSTKKYEKIKKKIRLQHYESFLNWPDVILFAETFSDKFYKDFEFYKLRDWLRLSWQGKWAWLEKNRQNWVDLSNLWKYFKLKDERKNREKITEAKTLEEFLSTPAMLDAFLGTETTKIKKRKSMSRNKTDFIKTNWDLTKKDFIGNEPIKSYRNLNLYPSLRKFNKMLYKYRYNIENYKFLNWKSFMFNLKRYWDIIRKSIFFLWGWAKNYKTNSNSLLRLLKLAVLIDWSWNTYINLNFITKNFEFYSKVNEKDIVNKNNLHMYFLIDPWIDFIENLLNEWKENKYVLKYWNSTSFLNYKWLLNQKFNSSYFLWNDNYNHLIN